MSWLPGLNAASASFDDVFALRANLHERYREFVSLLGTRRTVDPLLLELCRLRVAQVLGCPPMPALAAGERPSERKLAALKDWESSDSFSEHERACLAFADKFVRAPRTITDDDAAAVARHLSTPEIVAFTEALALLDGFTRFCAILGID